MNRKAACCAALVAASMFVAGPAAAGEAWPDLSMPARVIGGGKRDAAVVVGIQNYSYVSQIPGAEENAKGWYDYLAITRGVPPEKVKLLLGVDGSSLSARSVARSELVSALGRGVMRRRHAI